MKREFLDRLQNPPKRFRPIPFWSWNEDLDVEETRRQIAEMDRVGIGGYFMHARGGLQTPYMGEAWMANIAAGIAEGRDRGMGAWAYDENGWPSGFGDGRVNGRGEAFQQKYLRYEVAESEAARPDGRTIGHQRLEDGRLLHFYYDVNPFYVDTLDAEVIRTFLEEIYAPYAERFGTDFGEAMPGFFTDEPQVSRNGIPWSLTLPAQYQAAYGEDLLPLLPQLFLPVGNYQRTRYRFWHLVQELFVVNFTQQIYDWCTEQGCGLTGHMVLEETFLSQITSNGAVMPHYEFFHMPGMDWLGRHINPPTTPLQVASVAHQVGTKQILCETFALTGWNVTWEELKWMFEWQMVRGITQLCQHLEGYSLRGIRKRDYPPSLFFQQPWWDRYRLFNDAMTRVGMLLAEGEPAFEVLVLHPQSSAWLHFDNAANAGIQELWEPFLALTHTLEAAHVPFHYGDERILKRHGRVEGGRLAVGRQCYGAVVVPPAETLDKSTVALLQEFAANGGALVWLGRQPALVEGESDNALAGLCARGVRVETPEQVPAALPAAARLVSVSSSDGAEVGPIAVTCRRLDAELAGTACRFYFLANADTATDFQTTVRVPGKSVVRFAPEDGSLRPIAHRVEGESVVVEYAFPRMGSLALLVADEVLGTDSQVSLDFPRSPLDAGLFAGEWQLELQDPNALTLDTCDFWFDGALQAERENVTVIQGRALALERPVEVRMRFEVQVAPGYTPEGDLFLVIERPERFRIAVNGQPVAVGDRGCYRDTSFRKVSIAGRLRPGRNEIVLETGFRQDASVYENLRRARVFEAERNKLTFDSEIEAIYLVGGFGVATPGQFTPLPRGAMRYHGDFVLSPLPQAVTLGDLTPQGLPFFNGTVRLTRGVTRGRNEGEGRSFRFAEKMANIVGLAVNGTPVREWYWRPYEADLAGLLREGENAFQLELTGSLRNLLGPHHLQEGESYGVGPASFYKEPSVFGALPWNDDTCFVEFGLRV